MLLSWRQSPSPPTFSPVSRGCVLPALRALRPYCLQFLSKRRGRVHSASVMRQNWESAAHTPTDVNHLGVNRHNVCAAPTSVEARDCGKYPTSRAACPITTPPIPGGTGGVDQSLCARVRMAPCRRDAHEACGHAHDGARCRTTVPAILSPCIRAVPTSLPVTNHGPSPTDPSFAGNAFNSRQGRADGDRGRHCGFPTQAPRAVPVPPR